ncbi:hypothetical protein Tco_0552746 [Tanacetum coccineum]
MAASAIIISSDSSDESVGSPPSRVILFGDILTVIPSTSVVAPETSTIAPVISSAAPMVETTLVASPTGLCGLVPYTGSDSVLPDEMTSPEHISPLPAVSPFICTDSSDDMTIFTGYTTNPTSILEAIQPLESQMMNITVRSRGSDCDIPVVFSLVIALLRNKFGGPEPLVVSSHEGYMAVSAAPFGMTMYEWVISHAHPFDIISFPPPPAKEFQDLLTSSSSSS